MKKYNLLIKKINMFERLAQESSESPYTIMSSQELFGDGSKKKDIEHPNEYIFNLMRDSDTKYKTLSPEEQKAVDWWIGSSDHIKNPHDEKSQQLSQQFNNALTKFWVKNPTEKHPLIRRFRATEGEIQQLLKKGELTLQNNTSTSYKSMDKFGPHTFILRNVSQAYSLLGPNYSEAEMIIPQGARFKILNSKSNNRGGYIIELSEIN